MADDLQQLAEWGSTRIRKLDTAERRILTRKIATDLRRRNQKRIRDQVSPDGTRWQPRKPQQLRGKSGFIKRGAMFTKLRTIKYLKVSTSTDAASIGFVGRVARIASVHHHGQRERMEGKDTMVDYPERSLLGFASADEAALLDLLLKHLQGR